MSRALKQAGCPVSVGPVGCPGLGAGGVPLALPVNVSLDKRNLGAWDAVFDVEEILCLSICYLFYFRAQIASRAVVQVSAIKPTGADCLQLPAQLQGAAFPHLWGETLIWALCPGRSRKQSPPSCESPTELWVWKLPVGERA